jgi:hypothetical protein
MIPLHRLRPLALCLAGAATLAGLSWAPAAWAQGRAAAPRVVATPGDHIVSVVNR